MTTNVKITRALRGHVERIHALRLATEEWLQARGIEQWAVGSLTVERIAEQVERGDWYVAPGDGPLAVALRLLDDDVRAWDERGSDGTALYVHSLMVDRLQAGRRLGAIALDWASGQVRQRGRSTLRLDCIETNAALRRFYSGHGFTEVGRHEGYGKWLAATLFERPVPR